MQFRDNPNLEQRAVAGDGKRRRAVQTTRERDSPAGFPAAAFEHTGERKFRRALTEQRPHLFGQAVEYYLKLPDDLPERDAILVDPMLATGNSAVAAISRLIELRARSVKFVCLVAAPEGVSHVHSVFPNVTIMAAALDRCLNEHGYILPGLGDAGDRLFGTK